VLVRLHWCKLLKKLLSFLLIKIIFNFLLEFSHSNCNAYKLVSNFKVKGITNYI
jgi:hypothetical protein